MNKLLFPIAILLVSQSVYSQQTSSNNKSATKTNTTQSANVRYVPNQTKQNGQSVNVRYNPSQSSSTTTQSANMHYTPNQNATSSVSVGYTPNQTNTSTVNISYTPNQTVTQNNSQQGVQQVNTSFNPNQTNPSAGNTNTNPLSYNPNNTNAAPQNSSPPSNANPLNYTPATTSVSGQNGGTNVQQVSMSFTPPELKDVKYFVETNPYNVFTQDVFDKSYFVVRKIQIQVLESTFEEPMVEEVLEIAAVSPETSETIQFVLKKIDQYNTGKFFYHLLTAHH